MNVSWRCKKIRKNANQMYRTKQLLGKMTVFAKIRSSATKSNN
jgi:hypothetical protein